jgi:hypothetical protein
MLRLVVPAACTAFVATFEAVWTAVSSTAALTFAQRCSFNVPGAPIWPRSSAAGESSATVTKCVVSRSVQRMQALSCPSSSPRCISPFTVEPRSISRLAPSALQTSSVTRHFTGPGSCVSRGCCGRQWKTVPLGTIHSGWSMPSIIAATSRAISAARASSPPR